MINTSNFPANKGTGIKTENDGLNNTTEPELMHQSWTAN